MCGKEKATSKKIKALNDRLLKAEEKYKNKLKEYTEKNKEILTYFYYTSRHL
tara:strand:- start:36829 stop:36984 length:156 start_codon:yes stop_codon:yes gene_type:complete